MFTSLKTECSTTKDIEAVSHVHNSLLLLPVRAQSVMTVESRDPLKLVRRSVEGSQMQMCSSWELQDDSHMLAVSVSFSFVTH